MDVIDSSNEVSEGETGDETAHQERLEKLTQQFTDIVSIDSNIPVT